jgi:crotonobetainyl-CoA:carnitine CoA-transferase CaiB-like acyl-CoA transferase
LLYELIGTADMLVQNLSPAAADRLGLTSSELAETCPGLVRLSVSGFGLSGPWRNYLSFAAIGDGIAGITAAMRYEMDGHPLYQGSVIGDSITGYHAAFLALAAVYARGHHDGAGQMVDVAQAETLLSLLLAELADPELHDSAFANESPQYLLQRCMRTAGEDEWIALSIRDGAELANAVSHLTASASNGYAEADPVSRLQSLLRDRTKFEAFQVLQEVGIAACPVLTPSEVLADPHFVARKAHLSLTHPVTGEHPFVALGARANGDTLGVDSAAPLFGQHTRSIISSLPTPVDEIQRLFDAAVLAERPFNEGPAVGA